MHVIIRLTSAIILAIGLPAVADDFKDIAGYDEVSVADDSLDQSAISDISDAIGSDDELPPRVGDAGGTHERTGFANATPEPDYDSGMSSLANQFSKKKVMKKSSKKARKVAKNTKNKKKSKAKKRTLARI